MPRARIIEDAQAGPFRPSGGRAGGRADSPEALVEARVEEAFEKGREQGKAEAESQREAAQSSRENEIVASLELLQRFGDEVGPLLRDELIGLAAEIASRALRERLDAGDPVVERALHAALEGSEQGGPALFVCHPEDQALLENALEKLARGRDWSVKSDPRMARGGLVVQREAESVDARIESVLRRSLEILTSAEQGG